MKFLPIIKYKEIYHIGSFAGHDTSKLSYEGDALSVSIHPRAWQSIARLGGFALWRLYPVDGPRQFRKGVFLLMTAIKKKERKELIKEACAKGLLIKVPVWRVEQHDEDGEKEYFYTDSIESAYIEAEEDAIIKKMDSHKAGPKLRYQKGIEFDAGEAIEDIAIMQIAEDSGLYDGVWWNERLDVLELSAPRGALFQSRLHEWKRNRIEFSEIPEDDEEE